MKVTSILDPPAFYANPRLEGRLFLNLIFSTFYVIYVPMVGVPYSDYDQDKRIYGFIRLRDQ